ncbi:Holliday junction ATP-dependent DNA helicase RuvA [Spirochaetia bacterium]|nr:Holliday junction ATP-dependent DNA helicase RuvA [Spirochaetia bacterium]
MFNSLRGTITEKAGDCLMLLTGGLEWEIAMPATDMERLPPVGEEARVSTWLYHREDMMKLFGFYDDDRRSTFLELLKVDGIGPKGALKIMGGIGQEDLERALETEDLARLEVVPGLGKKTAQKMILALKGKLVHRSETPVLLSPHNDLVEALAEMGYDRRAAADALARAESALPPETAGAEKEQHLFRQAILYLSGIR